MGARIVEICRVKPDRRQKNKGYQSLPPEFCDSARGGCHYTAPQQREDAISHGRGAFLTLMTSPASWDSVSKRGRGASNRRHRPRGPSLGRKSRRKAAPSRSTAQEFEA